MAISGWDLNLVVGQKTRVLVTLRKGTMILTSVHVGFLGIMG